MNYFRKHPFSFFILSKSSTEQNIEVWAPSLLLLLISGQNGQKIKNGIKDSLALGNLDAARDWGHSKDYVRAMHLMMQNNEPKDYVVATGESRTVRDLTEYVFKKLDMNYKDCVTQDERFLRPEELNVLKGDSEPIRSELGWKPEYSFERMIDEMMLSREGCY